MENSTYLKGVLITLAGVLFLTPDSLCIRLIQANNLTLLFWRGVLLSLTLSLYLLVRYRKNAFKKVVSIGRKGIFTSILYAAASITFVLAVRLTTVANALLIIAAAPMFAAFFSFLFLKEKIPFRTILAIIASFSGIAFIFISEINIGNYLGELIALLCACVFGAQFVSIRHAKELDLVPSLTLSGVWVACFGLLWAPTVAIAQSDVIYLILAGAIIVPISFALITIGPRYLPAPEVGLFMLLETVIGPFWVWLALSEAPGGNTLLGGAIVITALMLNSAIGVIEHRKKIVASQKVA